MRSSLTSDLLGGALVRDLLRYLRSTAAAVEDSSPTYYKLISISGHYNTILGVLGALRLDTWGPAASFSWLQSIPKLASVLATELHGVKGGDGTWKFYVRMVAQDGPAAEYMVVPLPCAGQEAVDSVGEGACRLDEFVEWATPATFEDVEGWCSACRNVDVALCMPVAGTACQGTHVEVWKIVAFGVGVCAATVLLMLAAFAIHALLTRRHKRSGSSPHLETHKLPYAEMADVAP